MIKADEYREIEQQLTPQNVVNKVLGKRATSSLIWYLLEKGEVSKKEIEELLIDALPFKVQDALLKETGNKMEKKLKKKFFAILKEISGQLYNLVERKCDNCQQCFLNKTCPKRR